MNYRFILSVRKLALTVVAIVSLSAVACSDDDEGDGLLGPGSGVARGRTAFGIDDNNTLISFGLANPTLSVRQVTISGLQAGERILGIDFGPRDNLLYAVGSSSRLYVIDTTSGKASATSGAAAGNPAFTPGVEAGLGTCVDFNPVPNLVRFQSTTRQNLRLSPSLGNVAGVDIQLAYAPGDPAVGLAPAIAGCAYTNSVGSPIPTTTQLFAIDAARDALVVFNGNPNGGVVSNVGNLGVGTNENVGFDIPGAGAGAGTLYVSLHRDGPRSSLYTASPATGLATFVGEINHGRPLIGIAVAP